MYESINNTNFQGGFFIKTPAQNSQAAVVNKVKSTTRHYKIYRDFNGNQNSVFVAIPPKLDESVRKLIKLLGLEYSYYPQIDPWMNNLKSEAGLRRLLSRLVLKNEEITDTLNLVGINQGNYAYSEKNGAKIVRNKANDDTVHISPENRDRTRFIKILPGRSRSDAVSKFFSIRNGKVIHEYKTEELDRFNKKYNSTIFRTNISA